MAQVGARRGRWGRANGTTTGETQTTRVNVGGIDVCFDARSLQLQGSLCAAVDFTDAKKCMSPICLKVVLLGRRLTVRTRPPVRAGADRPGSGCHHFEHASRASTRRPPDQVESETMKEAPADRVPVSFPRRSRSLDQRPRDRHRPWRRCRGGRGQRVRMRDATNGSAHEHRLHLLAAATL